MEWERLGLIYNGKGKHGWDLHSAMTPTPFVFEDKVRIYAGFREDSGICRIGYVDLSKEDPTKILKISDKPVLDIGKPGTFDDNGVILGDIIRRDNKLYMYYVGFQLVQKVKFLAFTGLAISEDNGENFVRYSDVPVLDRKQNELYFNAIHTIIEQNGIYKCWMGAGSAWQEIEGKPYPSYIVKYTESKDGIHFYEKPLDCVHFSRKEEYRIGRPRVYFKDNKYFMVFTWGDINSNYQMGSAYSEDGIKWTRDDSIINFKPSGGTGWDSNSASYGAFFEVNNKTYMVYNGNSYGKDGFGLALLKN